VKIVELNNDLTDLLQKLKSQDRAAQKVFYQRYAPKLLSICRQYINDLQYAEDVMLKVFLKIFQNIDKYEHQGHIEAWMRKIAVNACITHIRAQKAFFYNEDEIVLESPINSSSDMYLDDIQKCIDMLPEGCKLVFVMYAIDGYKHHEIAETLNISVGTSKSQLAYARKILQSLLTQYNYVNHG
jgi:RNA polymerase sigma-70 factor (ECF subfamily)